MENKIIHLMPAGIFKRYDKSSNLAKDYIYYSYLPRNGFLLTKPDFILSKMKFSATTIKKEYKEQWTFTLNLLDLTENLFRDSKFEEVFFKLSDNETYKNDSSWFEIFNVLDERHRKVAEDIGTIFRSIMHADNKNEIRQQVTEEHIFLERYDQYALVDFCVVTLLSINKLSENRKLILSALEEALKYSKLLEFKLIPANKRKFFADETLDKVMIKTATERILNKKTFSLPNKLITIKFKEHMPLISEPIAIIYVNDQSMKFKDRLASAQNLLMPKTSNKGIVYSYIKNNKILELFFSSGNLGEYNSEDVINRTIISIFSDQDSRHFGFKKTVSNFKINILLEKICQIKDNVITRENEQEKIKLALIETELIEHIKKEWIESITETDINK